MKIPDGEATTEAHPRLPMIITSRVFRARPAQVLRAHTDPELFARWIGPDTGSTRIEHWDARRGGSYRYLTTFDKDVYAFYGSFHDITADTVVQTFSYEGEPPGVILETLSFTDLGDGRALLRGQSLCASMEERDDWLRSGMDVGVEEGFAKLDALIAAGEVA